MFNKLPDNQAAVEFFRCKKNPLYFIYNYVYIPEIGGRLKYCEDIVHYKFKRVIKSLYNLHFAMVMATRQLGKSTIAACIIEWALNFYPGIRAIVLNFSKMPATENLEKIKFIHENLPPFLRSEFVNRGRYKTYVEYSNGSIVRVFYPSTTTKPDTIARSLTIPILYIDECAHIRYMREIYSSAQPTLSKAREQAIKNKMPFFTLLTTTPNGSVGDGEWFYNMWGNALDDSIIFDNDNRLVENYKEISEDPSTNGFVRVRFHWSEDPTKDENWYLKQKRELNFDTRKINQELDLLFVGSTSCVFNDEFLGSLCPRQPVENLEVELNAYVKWFEKLNPLDYYVVGVDTAKTLTGDYCAIEIYNFSNFEQIGEFFSKLGSLTKFSECLIKTLDYINQHIGKRFILAIENNSIGAAIIEAIENSEYSDLIFTDTINTKSQSVGINTNPKTKRLMVSYLYDELVSNPYRIKSSDLISQLNIIEKHSNGTVSAKSGQNDDLFMASAMCAYTYRLEYNELASLIGTDIMKYQDDVTENITKTISEASKKDKPQEIPLNIFSEEEEDEDIFDQENPSVIFL